jgi:hypothetical protein
MFRKSAIAAFGACLAVWSVGCSSKTNQASSTTTEGATSTAPSGQQAANSKMALVRFVNATPGQTHDLWFGDTKAFTGVDYKTVTPYKEIAAERHDFKLAPAGSSAAAANPAATNSEGLNSGDHYTVVAEVDKDGKPKLDVITDHLSEPSTGKAKIRVINASQDEVDVWAPNSMKNGATNSADRMRNAPPAATTATPNNANGPDKWFGGVNSDSSTSYKDVDPMNGTLTLGPSGSYTPTTNRARKTNTKVAANEVTVPVDLMPGHLYTIIVTGGENGRGLDAIKVEDTLIGAQPK